MTTQCLEKCTGPELNKLLLILLLYRTGLKGLNKIRKNQSGQFLCSGCSSTPAPTRRYNTAWPLHQLA